MFCIHDAGALHARRAALHSLCLYGAGTVFHRASAALAPRPRTACAAQARCRHCATFCGRSAAVRDRLPSRPLPRSCPAHARRRAAHALRLCPASTLLAGCSQPAVLGLRGAGTAHAHCRHGDPFSCQQRRTPVSMFGTVQATWGLCRRLCMHGACTPTPRARTVSSRRPHRAGTVLAPCSVTHALGVHAALTQPAHCRRSASFCCQTEAASLRSSPRCMHREPPMQRSAYTPMRAARPVLSQSMYGTRTPPAWRVRPAVVLLHYACSTPVPACCRRACPFPARLCSPGLCRLGQAAAGLPGVADAASSPASSCRRS